MVREFVRRRTRVSLRVAIAAVSAIALLGQTATAPALAAGNAGLHLSKTVDPAQITVNPALGLTLGVDKASAIPGDTLTYTAVVTNAFSTFGVGGTFRAVSLGNADGTVAYYWDELQSCVLGCGDGTDAGNVHWIAFAGFVVGQTGYVPVMKPDVATGLTLTAAGVPANGVTYPAAGDGILGTVIQPQATATWNYQSSLMLTASQIALLSDPTKVGSLRNVVHFEVTVRDSNAAEPYIDAQPFTNPFQSQPNVGSISNITVNFTFPDGTTTAITSSQVAGLALLAPGASQTVTTTFKVAVPAARAAGETDAAYMARLVALEGSALTATLVDSTGTPIPNKVVTFNITGANPGTGTAPTDASGNAVFTYTGANAGNDVAQATVTAPGVTLNSNTANISWGKLLQPIVTGPAQGNFYPNPNNSCTFDVGPASTPAFGQTFPDILFNAPASAVPHDISTVTTTTRPFTDLTVDVNGNFNGTIVAQGSGLQAGVGTLTNFYAVFNGNFIVTQAGDLTFTILHDDGYILGVGNGATRVSGDLINPPATTPFNGYGVIAAWNQVFGGTPGTATIHFPAAGTYPYELDYSECGGGGPLYLVLETAQFIAQTDPLSVYVGYADGLRPGGSIFPFPWQGSPGVTFIGACQFDAGALRFDNSGNTDITLDKVTVDIAQFHFDIWPANLVVPAHQILILTQTGCFNFDTSDFSGAGCGGNNGVLPLVNVTRGGVTTTTTDTNQVLNTHGFDLACQGNESISWQRIAGTANTINVPLPPGASLNLTPFNVPGAIQGQSLALTVSAMDGAGNPVPNLPLLLQVTGANTQTLNGTTGLNGLATFTYVGLSTGNDSVQASAFIGGLRALSNIGAVKWSAPGGTGNALAPAITNPSPADGTIVTKPVVITATIAPPAGQTITSWRVFYQALDPGSPVTIASGTGTPPATLATFDPTLLPNDTYGVTIEATASGGAIQDLTTTLVVFGNLKPGRYQTTYQDLIVTVSGFQMEVRRTYDSIDKSNGDFGVGWKVSVSNFRTAPNRILGAGGWTQYNTSCTLGLCFTGFKNSSARFVTVTFPDQHTEVFDFTPAGGTNLFWECTPKFTARSSTGTTSTFQPLDDTSCSYTGDGNLYGSSGLYGPKRFQLTTHDGRVLVLDVSLGLISETDRNGNALTIGAAGIHSSSGASLTYTRDGSGRITQITGPSGQLLSYTYSSAGDLATSNDPNGNQTTYTYDSNHDLLKAVGGGQPLQTLRYDSSGRLVAITDALGNTTALANDIPGQKQTVTDPLGRLTTVYTLDDLGDVVRIDRISQGQTLTTTATYDSVGRPLTRTDPLGQIWTGSYDSNGNPLRVSTPSGNAVSVTYDSNGLPLSIRDVLGNQTTMAYDATGNLVSFTNALGQTQTQTQDGAGNRTSLTDALRAKWTYTYDAAGHVTSITDPNGHAVSFTFDSSGRLTSATDALGRSTTYAYDAIGNLTSATDALGGRTTSSYNPQGLLASRTDALGAVTTYSYDANHQLTSTTDPLGHVSTYTYDADGRLTSQTDAAGGRTTFAYDGFGRLLLETDQIGRVTSYSYDVAGRLVVRTLPNGGTFSYAYDADGRQVSVTDPLGRVSSSAYDAAGHLVSTTNGLGAVTQYSVDALGRTVSTTDPLGHVTTSTYDAVGNLTAATDAAGGKRTYAYDGAGNVTSATDALGNVTTYGYDSNNELTAVSDPLHRTTTSAYDALGRVTTITRPSGSASNYTYDALGHVMSIADALGNTNAFAYDAAGRRTSSTDPRGNVTRYTYDAVGRQIAITDALGGVVRTAYNASGQQK